MKKSLFKWVFVVMLCSFSSCGNNDEEGIEIPNEENSIAALANLNPEEPIIIDVSNDNGESIVLMGTKTQTGHAEKLQQMLITVPNEENPTEVFFDEDQ